jgi:hypothetical protein
MLPATLITLYVNAVMFALGLFPARAAYVCARDGERVQMGRAVFWSVTKTTVFFVVPAWALFLAILGSGAKSGAGMMPTSMGLVVLFFAGCLVLTFVWAVALCLTLFAVLIARNLPALGAALIVFASISFVPMLGMSIFAAEQARTEMQRVAGP